MKIAFFGLKPWEKEYIAETLGNSSNFRRAQKPKVFDKLKKHNLLFFDEGALEKNLDKLRDCEILSVFIYEKVDCNIIKKLPKLKFVTTRSTGFDHIDIAACKKSKIFVSNVPYYGENTVAEHTFGLILAISRHIHKSYVRTLRDDFSIEGLTGFDLKGKTIGIIGGGHIGMHVARIANGFEMNVLVYDLYPNQKLAKTIGFKYTTLQDLLKYSDIISLHAPYNKATHYLINKNNIKTIKKGAIIINTARGGLIDTDALLHALESKQLGGAGLDVIEGEDLIKEEKQLLHERNNESKWRTVFRDHAIFSMDNVVFTPHNAFNSKEALIRILDTTIENINSFSNKKTMNLVC